MAKRLHALMPNGEWHDFGAKYAAHADTLTPVLRDIFIASLVITEQVKRVGVGNVGEITLQYRMVDEETEAVPIGRETKTSAP